MQTIRAILPPTNPKFPAAATHVLIRATSLTAPPAFFYELQIRTPGAQVPAVGAPGEPGYVPAYTEPESVESLTAGNVSMTLAQWDNWRDDMTDLEYVARKICNRLDLTLAH
jgi:hypothetical protein